MYQYFPVFIQIKIVIYSFDNNKLNKGLKSIQAINKSHQISEVNNYRLPFKIKKYTLNRSPHIDKKSREQFKMVKYRHILNISCFNLESVIVLIHTIKHSLMQELSGIGLKIEFKYKTVII